MPAYGREILSQGHAHQKTWSYIFPKSKSEASEAQYGSSYMNASKGFDSPFLKAPRALSPEP